MTGRFMKITVPRFLRPIVYGTYASIFKVKTKDMTKSFYDFKNFSEFFTRAVKNREIDYNPNYFVSPCDS